MGKGARICLCVIILCICSVTKNGVSGKAATAIQNLVTSTPPAVQQRAVEELIARLLPDQHSKFIVRINSSLAPMGYRDAFTIAYDPDPDESLVLITATSGYAAAYAFNHYLKYTCNVQVAWEGTQGLDTLPTPLPPPPSRLGTPTPLLDRFRYYLNACTESYSMAWWNWTRYEREIDWMAMQAMNLPLVALGQEAIWRRVWLQLGLTEDEISQFFTGPAFLAWWRMGNLRRWGGPLPGTYAQAKLDLLRRVVARMREFGMTPVLPAFSGSVSEAVRVRFPNATVTQRGSWSHFNSTYSPWFLEPTDPLFRRISAVFRRELEHEVGTDSTRVYSCDTFNENKPSQNGTEYLRAVARATYQAMRDSGRNESRPQVVWVMQAWVFNYDRAFWSAENVRAYLSGVDVGNLLLLDLMADVNPAYIRFDSFYGHSFIWCMLQNFGGAPVLFGTMELVNAGIPIARNLSRPGSMIGLGMAPEGIEQNYVMYDFMSDAAIAWTPSGMQDMRAWVKKYVRRRYGSGNSTVLIRLQRAWLTLESGVYNAYPWIRSNSHTILSGRPSLNRTEQHWYKLKDISSVLADFLAAADGMSGMSGSSSLFRYDVVDIARQFLQHTTELVYVQVMKAYYVTRNVTELSFRSRELLDVLDDLDSLLATHAAFMTGTLVKAAESWAGAGNESERDLLRFNALNQITLWGPTGEIVDYSAKQWSGLIGHYVRPRWALFLRELKQSLASDPRKPFNEKRYDRKVLAEVEIPFTHSPSSLFPDQTSGDSMAEARRVYEKRKSVFEAGGGLLGEEELGFTVRERGRGQRLIPGKKRFEKWFQRQKKKKNSKKTNMNKKLALYYLKQISVHYTI